MGTFNLGSVYPPLGNFFASAKQFGQRGGFVNGLQPTLVGRIWYVLGSTIAAEGPLGTVVGSDGNNGLSPTTPFLTMARAFEFIDSFDVIVLMGVIREQLLVPLGVFDVNIVGAANQPRQCTDGGIYTGGGASWLAPTSPAATTPLLELREQGWGLHNFQMAGHTDDACVKMHCEETVTYPDASHLTLDGMRFTGGLIGLEDYGGASNVLVQNCSFEGMSGAGGGAVVVTNQGIRIPSRWQFQNNRILPCVNGIIGAFVDSRFINNTISQSTTATMNLASGNIGLRNFVVDNTFNIAAANFDPAGGVTGNATDTWINDLSDIREFGIPTN